MSFLPAAQFLVDFGLKPQTPEIAEEAIPASAVFLEATLAERVDEAYARGMEEGRAAGEAEAAARFEEQKAELQQGFTATHEAWCTEQGPRIAEQIATSLQELEDRIAASAERVLRPFLAGIVRDKAIDELRTIVHELIASNPGVTLEIAGPDDLLAAVRASLSASVATVSYTTSETCDVQIKAGATIIETCIAEWLRHAEGLEK